MKQVRSGNVRRTRGVVVSASAIPLLLSVALTGVRSENTSSALPIDTVPVADLHVHLSSSEGAALLTELEQMLDSTGAEAAPPAVPRAAADAIGALDRAGIERALAISNAYLFAMPEVAGEDVAPKIRAENTFVAEQVAEYPARLTGACSVNPLTDYALDEIRHCLGELALPVLKLHFTNSDVSLRSGEHRRRLREVFSELAKARAGAIVHMRTRAEDYGARDVRLFIDDVLVRVPGVPIHIAHMAGWGGYDENTDSALSEFVRALRDGRLNPGRVSFGMGAVVFQPEAAGADTALARTVRESNAKLADRIREIGLERVVYATDWPAWPPVVEADQAIAANVRLIRGSSGLTADELTQIFSNAGLLDALPPRP